MRFHRRCKTSTPNDFDEAVHSIDYLSRVTLKNPLEKHKDEIHRVPLQRLDCSFGIVRVEGEPLPLKKVISKESQRVDAKITIIFAIRRPGCGNCREHAQQLVELTKKDKRISLVGVVKEIGIADTELDNFYQNYFRNPVYRDEKWTIYKMMGNRKLSFFSLIRGHFKNLRRYKQKKIANVPFGGDLYTQGGLLVFDQFGELCYAYDEVFGEELDMNSVQAAIEGIWFISIIKIWTDHTMHTE